METETSGIISDGSTTILEVVQSVPSERTSKKTFVIQDSVIAHLDPFCDRHRIKKSDFLAVAIQDALI